MSTDLTVSKFYDRDERPPRGGWLAVVEGIEYIANSESNLVERIRQDWRNNGRTFTTLDIERAMWRYWTAREPERATTTVQVSNIRAADGSSPFDWKNVNGPKLWLQLHSHGADLVRDGAIDELNERRWLEQFRRSITCDECRINWNHEMAVLPPNFSTPTAFFQWTVGIHNRVNDRIGKPQFSQDDANALYLHA